MGRGLAVGLCAALALAMAACNAESDDTESAEQEHKEGAYVQANAPYFWSDTAYVPPSSFFMSIDPLEDDSILAIRLQAWADRFHDIVAAEVKKQTKKEFTAPKPIIKIAKSKDMMNAFVSGAQVRVPLRLANPENLGPKNTAVLAPAALASAWGGAVSNKSTAFDSKDFLSFWNKLAPTCKLTKVAKKKPTAPGAGGGGTTPGGAAGSGAAGQAAAELSKRTVDSVFADDVPKGDELLDYFTDVAVGDDCEGAKDLADGTDLSMIATSRFVHVSTDLIRDLDEDGVVFILAHELGHYYRAHATHLFPEKYDFWYADSDAKVPSPLPADEAADMREIYLEITRAPSAEKPVEKTYNPRMHKFLANALPTFLAKAATLKPDFTCIAAKTAWDAVGAAGTDAKKSKAAFNAYETAVETCAGAQALGELDGLTVAQARGWGFTKEKLGDPKTLGELLGALTTESVRLDGVAKAFKRKINSNHIGIYTSEQEADEMALDLATKVGIPFESIQKNWLAFGRAYENRMKEQGVSLPEDSMAMDRCEALANQGFKEVKEGNKTATPVYVPIGDLEEPHHDTCYRLFNMQREMKKHGYTVAERPAALTPAWDEIHAEADALSK